MTKFQNNWQRSSKEIDRRLPNFMIFWLFLIKTIAYKMKIWIFLNNPSMAIFHTSWYLTWCEILRRKNDQFSGKIRKGAISYKKVPIKWKCEFVGKIRLWCTFHFSSTSIYLPSLKTKINRSWENCVANEWMDGRTGLNLYLGVQYRQHMIMFIFDI